MDRRRFLQGSMAVGIYSFSGATILSLTGCPKEDEIFDGIKLAAQVATNLVSIVLPLGVDVSNIVQTIADNLTLVNKVYSDYEVAADSANKQNAVNLIKAIVTGISKNLNALLVAAKVKNTNLIATISVAIAIINTAIVVLSDKVGAGATFTASAAKVTADGIELPILKNAKKAVDLKNTWNAIIVDYPNARIK